jgi:hypothetical protein
MCHREFFCFPNLDHRQRGRLPGDLLGNRLFKKLNAVGWATALSGRRASYSRNDDLWLPALIQPSLNPHSGPTPTRRPERGAMPCDHQKLLSEDQRLGANQADARPRLNSISNICICILTLFCFWGRFRNVSLTVSETFHSLG